MLAITINNKFVRLALPEQKLFKKIPLSPSVEELVASVEKGLAGIELPSNEVIVGLNEGQKLTDAHSKTLETLGFKVTGFIPLALSLANLTKGKETPHLIVCLEDDELVFILVKKGGEVVFSATYPAKHILEATTAVLEFSKEKYQTTDIKKLYICGENAKLVAEALKKAGLMVEISNLEPSNFIKPLSLLQLPVGVTPSKAKAKVKKPFNIRKFLIGLVFVNGLAIVGFLIVTLLRPPTTVPTKVTPVPEAIKSAEPAGPIVVKDSEATESAVPSPTTVLDKSAYNIQVLNGRGTQGVAAKGQTDLEELGYTVTDIDNTAWSLYSIIKIKEGNEALLTELTTDLEADYEFGDSEILEADSEFDAVVILGSR